MKQITPPKISLICPTFNRHDQLENVLNLIRNDPSSRRIIITLWNPYTNKNAALPSCLCWYQFYVNSDKKELDLMINIRSSDFFLANNWNVCTGALLVHLICNLKDIENDLKENPDAKMDNPLGRRIKDDRDI